MIQVVQRSIADGRVKSIRIHDMLRDSGQSEARMDGFLHVCSGDMAVSNHISSHRAAFHNHINDKFADSSPHLLTLLGFNLVLEGSTTMGRFLNWLNLLRVLDLEGARDLKKLPKQIGNMIHLRYLGLKNTGLKRLPCSIGHLLNLQTLDARRTEISWLPKSFWKIQTLRHAYIDVVVFLISAPIIGEHQNLQTLRVMNIGPEIDVMNLIRLVTRFIKKWVTTPSFTEDTVFIILDRIVHESFAEPLQKMDNLVSLAVGNSSIPRDVLFTWAPNLQHLRSLTLEGELLLKSQQLPNSSQFRPNLTKLILTESELEQDPMPVLGKLPNSGFFT